MGRPARLGKTISAATTHVLSSVSPRRGSGSVKPYSATTRCANRLTNTLEQAAHRVAPEFAAFLTRHISDTVKSWDARDMSRQIELNIGKDLQFIRINGTLVGEPSACCCGCSRRSPRCCICILVSNDTIEQ